MPRSAFEQTLATPDCIRAGSVLSGRYRVGHCLARGGMGSIHAAARVGPRSPSPEVVVKVLRAANARDPRAADGLVREAAFLAMLAHPGIVRLIDFGFHERSAPYLVLERLPGVDLAEAISTRGPFCPLALLPIVHRLCEALASVHQQGVLHGDLKPANVMVTSAPDRPDGIKLLDFGLARFFRPEAGQGSSQLLGTPAYMAPELIVGQPETLDGRTDQFSLGALVYVALTGREPFAGYSTGDVLTRIRNDEPRPLRLGRADGDSSAEMEIDRVVRRAMAKRPADRYPTVLGFARALDRAIAQWTGRRHARGRPITRTDRVAERRARRALCQAETVPVGVPGTHKPFTRLRPAGASAAAHVLVPGDGR